jgi:hypothetical protein
MNISGSPQNLVGTTKKAYILINLKTDQGLELNITTGPESKKEVANGAGIGLAIGAGIGLIFGILIDNIGIAIGIGAALGLVFGSLLTYKFVGKKGRF